MTTPTNDVTRCLCHPAIHSAVTYRQWTERAGDSRHVHAGFTARLFSRPAADGTSLLLLLFEVQPLGVRFISRHAGTCSRHLNSRCRLYRPYLCCRGAYTHRAPGRPHLGSGHHFKANAAAAAAATATKGLRLEAARSVYRDHHEVVAGEVRIFVN